MARRRQIIFPNNEVNIKKTMDVKENVVKRSEEQNNGTSEYMAEVEEKNFDHEEHEEIRVRRSTLKNIIMDNDYFDEPGLVGVFGKNYKEEMERAFDELKYPSEYLILENIDTTQWIPGVDIYSIICAVLLNLVYSNTAMSEYQRRWYIGELGRISSATDVSLQYEYSSIEWLKALSEKLKVDEMIKNVLNYIVRDFRLSVIIPIDFGVSEINDGILRKLNKIRTRQVTFVVGSFINMNIVDANLGNSLFSSYFKRYNIINAD